MLSYRLSNNQSVGTLEGSAEQLQPIRTPQILFPANRGNDTVGPQGKVHQHSERPAAVEETDKIRHGAWSLMTSGIGCSQLVA